MSGRVAGQVYANNKGGAYVRRFSVPTNPSTPRQQAQRTLLATASAAWRNLTQPQRDAWKAWAQTHPVINRLGSAIILSGQGAFVQINSNVQTYDAPSYPQTPPPTPPTFNAPCVDPTGLTATAGANTITIVIPANVVAGDIIGIYATPPISAGRTTAKEKERLIEAHTVTAGEVIALLIDFSAAYKLVWGNLTGQVGQRVLADFYCYSSGLLNVAITGDTLVV